MKDVKPHQLKHKILPLSFRGSVMILFSLFLLITGIARADLAGIFWGAGFSILVLVAAIGNLVFMISLRGAAIKGRVTADLKLASEGVFPEEISQAHFKIELPRFWVPGFSLLAITRLFWQNRQPLVLQSPIAPGTNRFTLDFTPLHRGVYFSHYIEIRVFDLLGFSNSSLQLPLNESLRVFPAKFEVDLDTRASQDEKQLEFQQNRIQSDELLEVKKYYPGDDHRKLNWKIYAHTGELFVRKGEEVPPPESNFCFVLYRGASTWIKTEFHLDILDILIAAMGQAMLNYLNQGYPVLLTANNESNVHQFTPSQAKDLLKYLASLTLCENSNVADIPDLDKKQLLVFALPGTGGLDEFLANFNSAKSISLFIKELPYSRQSRKGINFKEIFYYNTRFLRNINLFSNNITGEDYRFQLDKELLLFKNRPRRIKDVKSF